MIRVRVGLLTLMFTGLLFGVGTGFLVFKLTIDHDSRFPQISKVLKKTFALEAPFVKYSGTVLRHDESKKVLVLKVPSSYSLNPKDTFSVSVPYDSQTDWMSIEYVFSDGIMEARHWSSEQPRDLPRDTLVSVVEYFDGTEWRTIALAYLRRTNI